jgi:hypothetical protein
MDVKATTEALSYVLERGGRLFLWTKGFGAAWATDETSTSEPPGVEFDLVSNDVIEILLERGIDPPETLRLELRRRPRQGLKIHWDERSGANAAEQRVAPAAVSL